MTVTEFAAKQTERMAGELAHFVATTAPDRLTWKPELAGSAPTRSILEQVAECAGFNQVVARLLRGEEVSGWEETEYADSDAARRHLLASAAELADAMRSLTEVDLSRVYKHPRALIPGENLLLMPYRNMAYHAGQINLYQTLAGDAEFHVPPTWR